MTVHLFLILFGLFIIHFVNCITIEYEELRYSNQPGARSEYTAASDDDNDIIIFGGFKSDFELHHDLYVFDSAASKWIRHADAPASYARRGASGVYYKGSLYIFGGTDIKFQYTNTIFKFNFETNQWSEITPASGSSPTRYKHGAAVTSDGKMYVYGGNNGSGFIAGLSYYDIPTNKWVTVSQTGNIPTPRSMLSLSVFTENNDVKLILFGGLFNYNSGFNGYCPPDLFMFDIKTGKWSIRSPAGQLSPTKRTGQCVSVFGDKYFVFGGYSDRFLSDSHFFFSDTNTWSGNINTVGPFYPNGLTNGGMSCISKTSDTASCFVFGGVNGNHTQGYLDYLWHIGITF